MRQFIALIASISTLVGLNSAAFAGPILIDDFKSISPIADPGTNYFAANGLNITTTNFAANTSLFQDPIRGFVASTSAGVNSPTSLTINETVGLSSVLGGKRSTTLDFSAISLGNGQVNTKLNTTDGLLTYNADANVTGKLSLYYDYTLTPQNFTGQAGLAVTFNSNSANGLILTVTIVDGGSFSTTQSVNNITGSPMTFLIPFDPNTDESSIKSITLSFSPPTAGQNFALAGISTYEVPEPATIAICGIFGVAGLMGVRRKMKKTAELTVAA